MNSIREKQTKTLKDKDRKCMQCEQDVCVKGVWRAL